MSHEMAMNRGAEVRRGGPLSLPVRVRAKFACGDDAKGASSCFRKWVTTLFFFLILPHCLLFFLFFSFFSVYFLRGSNQQHLHTHH